MIDSQVIDDDRYLSFPTMDCEVFQRKRVPMSCSFFSPLLTRWIPLHHAWVHRLLLITWHGSPPRGDFFARGTGTKGDLTKNNKGQCTNATQSGDNVAVASSKRCESTINAVEFIEEAFRTNSICRSRQHPTQFFTFSNMKVQRWRRTFPASFILDRVASNLAGSNLNKRCL